MNANISAVRCWGRHPNLHGSLSTLTSESLMRHSLAFFVLLWPILAIAGLDVTAYEKLVAVQSPQLDKDGRLVGPDQIKLAPVQFVERFAGLTQGQVYRYQSAFDFRAGAYSGYSYWRNELAKLAGNEQTPFESSGKTELRYDATVWKFKRGPFWELIDFSDAEGVIGPVVCKRVYQDFLRYLDLASTHPDEYFRTAYRDWMKAFAMCANDGAIVFH
jgi:hypothetical protein